jgi:NTP pyrophosphohydrolases containing a Zn-finger, probably nucleic-acid-binding
LIITPREFQPLLGSIEHPATRTFVFRRYDLLLREDGLVLPDESVVASLGIEPKDIHPVGVWNDTYYRTTWVADDAQAPPGHVFKGLRTLFGTHDDAQLAVASRAIQIAEWARTHRFCGRCGKPTMATPGERAMRCACGHTTYPRISPAMMVLVRRGDAILLARNVNAPSGRMSALAGFLEPGESVEDAVHREVHEEVGLFVKDLRYFGSQSWPFPGSLMVAFTAEYAGGEIRVDEAEIAEARWFAPGDELPELPPPQSISRALIEANLPR